MKYVIRTAGALAGGILAQQFTMSFGSKETIAKHPDVTNLVQAAAGYAIARVMPRLAPVGYGFAGVAAAQFWARHGGVSGLTSSSSSSESSGAGAFVGGAFRAARARSVA